MRRKYPSHAPCSTVFSLQIRAYVTNRASAGDLRVLQPEECVDVTLAGCMSNPHNTSSSRPTEHRPFLTPYVCVVVCPAGQVFAAPSGVQVPEGPDTEPVHAATVCGGATHPEGPGPPPQSNNAVRPTRHWLKSTSPAPHASCSMPVCPRYRVYEGFLRQWFERELQRLPAEARGKLLNEGAGRVAATFDLLGALLAGECFFPET